MAQIDASIPLGVKPFQMPDQMNALAKMLQLQELQQNGAMGQMRMQEYQQGIQRKNKLQELVGQSYATPEERENALMKGGFLDEATKLGKDRRENLKTDTDITKTKKDAEKIDFEMEMKKVEHISSVLSTARDPASYEAARQEVGRISPGSLANLPPQFDPASIQAIIAKGQTITQRLADERQRQQIAETGRHNRTTEGLTARGQNMTDARARESTAATMSKPFEVTGDDGKPVLVQQDKQGNIRPVQGYAPKSGGKPMTEGQAKANLFGSRMKESDRILTGLEGKYSPMAVNSKMSAEKMPGVGGLAGAVGNAMLSEQGQMAEQAQRDFVNAVLRRESGAVISDPEFANAQKQYFPQPNDTPAVLQQKRRNRQMAIQGLEAEVPGGLRVGGAQNPPAGGASGGWSIQKVE